MLAVSKPLIALAGVLVVALAACAPASPAPGPSTSPSPSASSLPAPERPTAALGIECADLVDPALVASAAGIEVALDPASAPDSPVTSLLQAARLAGGLLDCVWGDVDGSAAGVRVSVLPLPDGDQAAAYIDAQLSGCFDRVGSVTGASCGEDRSVNGYWLEVTSQSVGTTPAEAQPAATALVDSVAARVAGAPAPSGRAAALNTFAGPLCDDGAATVAEISGVGVDRVVETGHGSDYGIDAAAADLGGFSLCTWEVADTATWQFASLPSAGWLDTESLRPFGVDSGVAPASSTLGPTTIAGADSAWMGVTDDISYARVLVDDELLDVTLRGGGATELTSGLEALLARF